MSLDNTLLSLIVNAVSFNANLTLTPLVPTQSSKLASADTISENYKPGFQEILQENLVSRILTSYYCHNFVSENSPPQGIVQTFGILLALLSMCKGYEENLRIIVGTGFLLSD